MTFGRMEAIAPSLGMDEVVAARSTFFQYSTDGDDNSSLHSMNKALGDLIRKLVESSVHHTVSIIPSSSQRDVDIFINSTVNEDKLQEPFFVLDLGVLVRLFYDWIKALPRVLPYYAVKCNPSRPLLATMAALGAGFDCASKLEVEEVLALGVAPQRIIFANPCKMPSHINYAACKGVHVTTFDSEGEVMKVKANDPNATLLLRLKTDDESSKCPLGVKYGALMSEVDHLLLVAANAEVPVIGVSFHIGSGACDAQAYTHAIAAARSVFDKGEQLGLPPMSVLDIGGGFTVGTNGELKLAEAAEAINAALDQYFPPGMGVSIVAEPGRFFAECPTTLATTIYGKRVRGELVREYWINDGIYGSMNNLIHDYAVLRPRPLACASHQTNLSCTGLITFSSTVFGPTCDSLDTVLKDYELPDLADGDWIVFSNMGAYTHCAGSSFNGYSTSDIRTYCVFSLHAPVIATTPASK